MSYKRCAIYKCTPNRNDFMYNFPDPKTQLPLFQKWLIATGNSKIELSTREQIYYQHRVCQKHFLPKDVDKQFNLRDDAFPKLYLPHPKAKTLNLAKTDNTQANVNKNLYCLKFVDVENGKSLGLFQLKGESKTNTEVNNEDRNAVLNFITNVKARCISKSLDEYKSICVCRICLKAIRREEAQSLIGDSMITKHVQSMLEELIAINLSVTENPALCGECVRSIADAFSFKMMSKSNEEKIRNSLTPNKKMVDLFELTDQNKLSKLYETVKNTNANKHGATNKTDTVKPGATNKTDTVKHGVTNKTDTVNHEATNEMDVSSFTNAEEVVGQDIEGSSQDGVLAAFDNMDYSNHLSDLEDYWYEEGHKTDGDDGTEGEMSAVSKESVLDCLRDHDYVVKGSYPKTLPSGDNILSSKFDYLFEKKRFSGNLSSHRAILRRRMSHLRQVVTKVNGPFLCHICGLRIDSILYKKFSVHMSQKHSIKEGRLVCNVCGKSFKKSVFLYSHQRAGHVDSTSCECCGKVFKCKQKYLIHRQYINTRQRVQCHVCGKSLSSKPNLRFHLRTHLSDSQRKKYPCQICDRRFNDKECLKRHMFYHQNKGEYECEICGKILSYEWSLDKHVKIMHLNKGKHKCEVCNVTFYKIETLKSHMKTKHKIGPAGRFRCDFCYKTFFSKSTFEHHVLVRHGENVGKLLVCRICQYKCKSEQILEQHCVNKHTVYVGKPVSKASFSRRRGNFDLYDEESDVEYFSC